MSNEVERSELIQSLKAFLIPVSLFLATVCSSAGVFLLYNGYQVGICLVALGFTVVVVALVAFVRFQNKQRAQGRFTRSTDS
jgi:hypothetical protein